MTLAIVEKIVEKVFPAGTTIEADSLKVSDTNFLLILGKNNYPRWLIPSKPTYGLPILQNWVPYDLNSRVKWSGLLTAYQWGLLTKMPFIRSIQLSIPPNSNWKHVGWNEVLSPIPCIYIGTPTLSQKAVTFLIDTQIHQATKVSKIPLGQYASNSILAEANILSHLEKQQAGLAPRVLFQSIPDGTVTQQYLAGSPIKKPLTNKHIDFLLKLRTPQETTLEIQKELLFKRKQHFQIKENYQHWFYQQCQQIEDNQETIPTVYVHGDFTPWNLKCGLNGEIFALDWENAILDGIPLFDLIHYHFMQAYLRKENLSVLRLLLRKQEVQTYLNAFNITNKMASTIFKLYLLHFWCNRIEQEGEENADYHSALLTPLLDEKK